MRIRLLLLSGVVALIVFASCKKTTTKTIIQHDTTTVKTFDTTNYAMVDSVFSDLNGTPFPAYAYPDVEYYTSSNSYGPISYLEIDPSDSNGNNYDIYIGTSLPAFTARTYGALGDTTTEADFYISFNGQYYYGSTVLNPNTITVTSISGSSMKGTFRGTVYVNGDTTQTGSNKQVITNGKFSIAAL